MTDSSDKEKDGYKSRIFYGALLALSFFAAHFAGALYICLYLIFMILCMMGEIGQFVSDEVSKFLRKSQHYRSKAYTNGSAREKTPSELKSPDISAELESFEDKDVSRVAKTLKVQLIFLVLLAVFWYYCRALASYSDFPIEVFRNSTKIGLPQIQLKFEPDIIFILQFIVRNYNLCTALLYSVYVVHLIIFCSRHFSRDILVGEIVAAASHHMAIFLAMFPCFRGADVNMDFGVFWGFISLSGVIINDIAAYVIGKTRGKRLLTFLSPKKTVEGFIGAFFVTIIFALSATYIITNYAPQWLELPLFFQGPKFLQSKEQLASTSCLTSSESHCHVSSAYAEFSSVPSNGFEDSCPTFIRDAVPSGLGCIYLHVIVLALFASLVAPFGGLLASGIKRSLNRKDFGTALGSHGGFTDRFDCKGLQSVLAYAYLSTVLNENIIKNLQDAN